MRFGRWQPVTRGAFDTVGRGPGRNGNGDARRIVTVSIPASRTFVTPGRRAPTRRGWLREHDFCPSEVIEVTGLLHRLGDGMAFLAKQGTAESTTVQMGLMRADCNPFPSRRTREVQRRCRVFCGAVAKRTSLRSEIDTAIHVTIRDEDREVFSGDLAVATLTIRAGRMRKCRWKTMAAPADLGGSTRGSPIGYCGSMAIRVGTGLVRRVVGWGTVVRRCETRENELGAPVPIQVSEGIDAFRLTMA